MPKPLSDPKKQLIKVNKTLGKLVTVQVNDKPPAQEDQANPAEDGKGEPNQTVEDAPK